MWRGILRFPSFRKIMWSFDFVVQSRKSKLLGSIGFFLFVGYLLFNYTLGDSKKADSELFEAHRLSIIPTIYLVGYLINLKRINISFVFKSFFAYFISFFRMIVLMLLVGVLVFVIKLSLMTLLDVGIDTVKDVNLLIYYATFYVYVQLAYFFIVYKKIEND